MKTQRDIEDIAQLFKVLSDPTRLRLLLLLGAQVEKPEGLEMACDEGSQFLCVNALSHRLQVTQSAVSQHLRILRQVGLVQGVRRGPFMHYTLNKDTLEAYREALRTTLTELALFG